MFNAMCECQALHPDPEDDDSDDDFEGEEYDVEEAGKLLPLRFPTPRVPLLALFWPCVLLSCGLRSFAAPLRSPALRSCRARPWRCANLLHLRGGPFPADC